MVDRVGHSPESPVVPCFLPRKLSPSKAPTMPAADPGLLAAIVFAGGVTAVVAIVIMAVQQHRAARLTASRGALSVTLGLGVLALAGLGIVALSPVSAEASTPPVSHSVVDVQLPTE